MKQQVKKRRYYTRTIDLAFLTVLLFSMVYAFYHIWKIDMLPELWFFATIVAFALIWLILLILSLKKAKKWWIYTKRVLITILCGAFLFAGYSSNNFITTLNKMNVGSSDPETPNVEQIHLVTLKDSNYTKISDFSNAVIGVQNNTDKENSFYGKEQIEKEKGMSQVKFVEDMDYTSLHDALLLGNIDGYIISDSKFSMMKATTEGYEDSVKIVKTYERTLPTTSTNQKDISKESFTILISGLDETGSPDQKLRSDVNILMFVNPKANHISMVSLSRDSYMPNAALNFSNDKLTHTGIYGIDATVETIENFFGIDIDYYARVSFTSLIEIVDAIGGINVDVEIDFCEQDENREFGDKEICLSAGQQTINGKEALAYARHRKTEGYDNPGRERAQQRIIKGIINQLLSINGIASINNLLEIAPNYVVTDMPASQISSFVKGELKDLKPWSISSVSIGSGDYEHNLPVASLTTWQNVYVYSKEDVQKVLDAYSAAMNGTPMNEFSFNMTTLSNNTLAINNDPNILYDDGLEQFLARYGIAY